MLKKPLKGGRQVKSSLPGCQSLMIGIAHTSFALSLLRKKNAIVNKMKVKRMNQRIIKLNKKGKKDRKAMGLKRVQRNLK